MLTYLTCSTWARAAEPENWIRVEHKGAYVAKFYLKCPGFFWESGSKAVGYKKTVALPAGVDTVLLNAQLHTGFKWKTIIRQEVPVKRIYTVTGTTTDPGHEWRVPSSTSPGQKYISFVHNADGQVKFFVKLGDEKVLWSSGIRLRGYSESVPLPADANEVQYTIQSRFLLMDADPEWKTLEGLDTVHPGTLIVTSNPPKFMAAWSYKLDWVAGKWIRVEHNGAYVAKFFLKCPGFFWKSGSKPVGFKETIRLPNDAEKVLLHVQVHTGLDWKTAVREEVPVCRIYKVSGTTIQPKCDYP